jgi:hypothetical protein
VRARTGAARKATRNWPSSGSGEPGNDGGGAANQSQDCSESPGPGHPHFGPWCSLGRAELGHLSILQVGGEEVPPGMGDRVLQLKTEARRWEQVRWAKSTKGKMESDLS